MRLTTYVLLGLLIALQACQYRALQVILFRQIGVCMVLDHLGLFCDHLK